MPLTEEEDNELKDLGQSTATGAAGDKADRRMNELVVRAQIRAADALEDTAKGQKTTTWIMLASVVIMLISTLVNVFG